MEENKNNESYLLKNIDELTIKDDTWCPSGCGYKPENRPIAQYIDYGVVTIDKPANPSSHEVVTWVKEILNKNTALKCNKTGHSGTLDPKVTGVLTICINRATRLAKIQQSLGKTYVCEIKFDGKVCEKSFRDACKKLTGHLLQRPPLLCAVKRELRLRWIYDIEVLEFVNVQEEDKEFSKGLFVVKCEAGSYIRTLCTHIGLFVGVPAEMEELRRIKSGSVTEKECCTLHDLLDAVYVFTKENNEKYLRKLIKPLESLLTGYKRIIIKDSAAGAICAGAKLSSQGISMFDKNIVTGELVVLLTAKGEAVALANAMVSGEEMEKMTVGFVASAKRVIMEQGIYKKTWGISVDYEIYSEEGNNKLEVK
ncbi:cbf5 [Ecytonucleospora hepatopenaei]|uniref:H/ACA ribonucleoprotein complex subunit CBF5 n=1 Tax=Ecytonucleospora hepatopenaei TaxID=646526 RepID=A0A1W0E7J7_9MICR|nr:cbf5 [Ecytonucleospora hepatopenaei]